MTLTPAQDANKLSRDNGTPGKRPTNKRRHWLSVGLALVSSGVALAVALSVWFDPWFRQRVRAEALARGVELNFADYDLSLTRVTLQHVTFSRSEPLLLNGTAESITVELANFKISALAADNVKANLTGSVAEAFARGLPATVGAPAGSAAPGGATATDGATPAGNAAAPDLRVTQLNVSWRSTSLDKTWLELSDAVLTVRPSETKVSGQLTLFSEVVGPTTATWDDASQRAVFSLALGQEEPTPNITGELSQEADALVLRALLHKTPPAVILRRFGATAPERPSVVEGSFEFTVPLGLSGRERSGRLALNLPGYVPPHPAELNGFDFGNETALTTDFVVSLNYERIRLKNTRLQAGQFGLSGGGAGKWRGGALEFQLTLNGALRCAVIADAAVRARLGSVLGQLLGKSARKFVTGSVAVEVDVAASSRALDQAQIKRKIGVGCGLRPLTLDDLPRLKELPVDLETLKQQLEGLPKNLGSLRERLRQGSNKSGSDKGDTMPGIFDLPLLLRGLDNEDAAND